MAGKNTTQSASKAKAQGGTPAATNAQAVTAADLASIKATHVVVRSLVPNFRRAGRAWPVEETAVPLEEFSEAELDSLLDEPNLLVGFIELPAEKTDAGNGSQEGQQ